MRTPLVRQLAPTFQVRLDSLDSAHVICTLAWVRVNRRMLDSPSRAAPHRTVSNCVLTPAGPWGRALGARQKSDFFATGSDQLRHIGNTVQRTLPLALQRKTVRRPISLLAALGNAGERPKRGHLRSARCVSRGCHRLAACARQRVWMRATRAHETRARGAGSAAAQCWKALA